VLIIAHRGASAEAPENTLAAFRRAIELGADGVELDVRLAADGVPVVIHDATLKRTASIDRRVADMTSTELARLDVGSWFNRHHGHLANEAYALERIPTLERVLDFLHDPEANDSVSPEPREYMQKPDRQGGRDRQVDQYALAYARASATPLIYIELKIDTSAEVAPLTDAVARVVAGSPLAPNLIVQSFDLRVITRIRKHLPDIKTAALFGSRLSHFVGGRHRIIDLALEHGADHLSLHHSLVTKRISARAAAANLPITAWTIDDPNQLRRATELGIYAVITNDPATLRRPTE
jgi:glycerophosphoryl diester phosphodiesterase